jgi:DNA invertase Pin-like site-specific DNA recombinase
MQPPKRYVGYYRVSTNKQGQSGLGLEAQQKAAQEFLHHYGGELIAEYVEVESGKKDDRPEFLKAVDYAELANGTLLVAKLDRLSRDLHFITNLQKKGIPFKLADMPEVDQLTVNILGSMAQHEARMISMRTKAALQVAKERGIQLGNPLLSYQRNLDTHQATEIRTQSQKVWREKIFKVISHLESSEHLSSCKDLAAALNDRGLTTYYGGQFSIATVSRLRRQRDRG